MSSMYLTNRRGWGVGLVVLSKTFYGSLGYHKTGIWKCSGSDGRNSNNLLLYWGLKLMSAFRSCLFCFFSGVMINFTNLYVLVSANPLVHWAI